MINIFIVGPPGLALLQVLAAMKCTIETICYSSIVRLPCLTITIALFYLVYSRIGEFIWTFHLTICIQMPTWKCLLMLKIAPNISFWTQFKIMLEEEIGSGSWASKQIKLRKTRKMIAVDRRSLCCSVWRVYHCTPGQETRARQEPDTGSSQGMGPLQTCQRCWTRFNCEASKLACLNAHLWLCESADNRYFLQGQCTFRGLLHWAFHSECCQTWPTCLGPLVQTMAPDSCCTSADSRQHHCQPTQITAPLQTNLSGHGEYAKILKVIWPPTMNRNFSSHQNCEQWE